MKATLEFNLPEDHSEHLRAVHAAEAWVILSSIDNKIRNAIKHGLEKDTTYQDLLAEIRREIGDAYMLLRDE